MRATPSWSEQPRAVTWAGMLALAVAMGVGRFAFTPLLPMMLHDGVLTLAEGSWLATANYVGYLAGALACMALPWVAPRLYERWHPARLARAGLVATVLLTAAMALPLPGAWPLLRFAAGVASAFVLLNVAAWCMVRLTVLGRPSMGGLVFCGPGVGIALTGLAASAMVAAQWRASTGWVVCALLSVLLCAVVWPVVRGRAAQARAGAPHPHAPARAQGGGTVLARGVHALAYGLAGLGYIVTATFLPVIARAALPAGSPWPDLFWPMFGVGVTVGAALSTRANAAWDRRWLLCATYGMQALGIALGLWWPTPAGFALSSCLVGLPFTAITFYGLQEARRLWPQSADSFASLITAAYGLGQIMGPPMVAWLLARGGQAQGFAQGLALAAGALVAGAVMYAASAWRWPLVR
ncbi:YbfB/YjiJ family MFS transporter [Alicycliphilus denitrificans]|uniref:YbfB/YjiJ family MFS transporter n=1 Tax=Alicycliphilus denitrificans TaxID=179636 RepID=A0A3R7F1H8_9BURK|nr:YbfB/YjiJ family MFS transporter [Alicycliphilus denitrificans]RKJ99134.1 YbfB/YjiJ family MFS transporter [Alicycliphilus denitrificans]